MQKEHVVVYREAGKFAGWPANYGMWIWGDEIVVGFTQCTQDASVGPDLHTRDRSKPAVPTQARSLDGGRTWQAAPIPAPSPGGRGFSADEHMLDEMRVARAIEQGMEPLPRPYAGGIDFTAPDFAMMCARTGLGAGTTAWFYLTDDRAQTWQGPFSLPLFGEAGIEARTDYLVNGPQDCMIFLTASAVEGREGKGVFMARTTDGGKSFQKVAWVTSSETEQLIMPGTVRVDENTLLTAVRCRQLTGEKTTQSTWIDLYESTDNGASFHHLNRPAPSVGRSGNPPALTKLHDGRICLVYGYRSAPFGIHARLSEDNGKSWGEVIHLREDGGAADLGYPRTVQRADGTLVTAYYFNDHPDTERYIAATLWKP